MEKCKSCGHTKDKKKKKIEKVLKEGHAGKLHSGSKNGPIVSNPKQMVAIALSEARRMKKTKKK